MLIFAKFLQDNCVAHTQLVFLFGCDMKQFADEKNSTFSLTLHDSLGMQAFVLFSDQELI